MTSQSTTFATLPCSKESEMMVLGSMLTSQNSFKIAINSLDESDFYFSEHQLVLNTLKILYRQNKPADLLLVIEELKRQSKSDVPSRIAYVTSLAQYAGTSIYVEEYIEELKKFSQLRQFIHLAQKMAKNALDPNQDPTKIALEAHEQIKCIEKCKPTREQFPIKFLHQLEKNYLFTEPQKKPMLLEYTDENGKPLPFLPKGIVAMLVGAGGVGKTHLLAQLTISIATGTPFLDIFNPTHYCGEENKGSVFFGLGENHYDDIHRILHKAAKELRKGHLQILEDALFRIAPFSFCGQQAAFLEHGKPSRYFRELKTRLENLAPENGWSLIILDPVSRLLGADAEEDNASATQFIALLEELTLELPGNPTVLFAHHVNKSAIDKGKDQDQTAARGSSALTDGVRWQANFIKSKGDRPELKDVAILKMTKSNFTAILDDIKTKRSLDGFLKHFSDAQQQDETKANIKKKNPIEDIFSGRL